ncbi:MAG: hypothetical protein LBH45_03430 [Campylobacteraceae bacterium]|jgi:hypothetical protein|nr:hypothetical protein [Campylobacteraceae bacterium]
MKQEDYNFLVETINSQKWIVARTRLKNPHAYCLRKNFINETDFEKFVLLIREHGYKTVWRDKQTYICLDIDGYRYWSMGFPLEQTILINRATGSLNLQK